MSKLENNFSLEELTEYVNSNFPDYVLAKLSDFEAPTKDTYKYLYEKTASELQECQEEMYNLLMDKQSLEKELSDLSASLDTEKKRNGSFSDTNKSFVEFISKYISEDVAVSDVEVYDANNAKIESKPMQVSSPEELSDNPGIYDFKRPSWFTPLRKELDRHNMAEKNINNTKETFLSRIFMSKKLAALSSLKDMADTYDSDRKKRIAKILLSPGSNEEKYLKYILVTPGMPKDFQSLLFTASNLGLDANVVIELLEQPKESFNKEVIESFISELRKGNEYNLKQELANELVRGEWYVTITENNITKKLQLVPIDEIRSIQENLENISKALSGNGLERKPEKSEPDEQYHVSDTAEPEVPDEEQFPDIFENVEDYMDSSMINFDDSMI